MMRIDLSTWELERLIEHSTADRFVDCAFGNGEVKLILAPHTAWAADLLVQWRDGARREEVLTAIAKVELSGVRMPSEWSIGPT